MWSITLRELKDKKWSLIAYSLGSLLMLWLYVATFRSSQSTSQQLLDLVKSYPKALVEAIGLTSNSLNSIEIYLNAKNFSLMWPLLAIILGLSRAAGQIAGEIQSGTMGLLLALPLERWRIFVAKYLSGLVTILIFTAVSVFAVIPFAKAYDIPSHFDILAGAFVLMSLFMWAVYSVGLLVSSVVTEKGTVYAVVGSSLILMYVANILSLINDNLAWLKHYSIFYYFNTQSVLTDGHVTLQMWGVFGGIIVIASLLAAWRFNSRDISV